MGGRNLYGDTITADAYFDGIWHGTLIIKERHKLLLTAIVFRCDSWLKSGSIFTGLIIVAILTINSKIYKNMWNSV